MRFKRMRVFPSPIDTFYPEVYGGYYFNPSIVGDVVQSALSRAQLAIVIADIYRPQELIPTEPTNGLRCNDEEYYIIDSSQNRLGALLIWESLGGASFYHDRVIVDVWLPPGIALEYRSKIVQCASEAGVSAVVKADVATQPLRPKSWLRKIFSNFSQAVRSSLLLCTRALRLEQLESVI